MENLRRHFSKKKDTYSVIGRVKRNGHCKKHPKHHQSPGVCSLCLREKLSQLSSSNSRRRTTSSIASSSSSSSISSYYSSASASSCASPIHCFCFTTEPKSNPSSSVSIFLLSDDNGIIKGRCSSLDIFRRKNCEVGHHHNNKSTAYKTGFWFNFLHPQSKRMKECYRDDHDTKQLVRSMSIKMRETMA
ncbi:hypothetical protein VNO78_31050 [Psophocarpus tetragonolobus]|uniref:Uncharacterized protein n=1 Tax=Psophocarpus tetragonolobus TaxID=3891 RepID=A0AAN9X8P7_PSOTE